MGKKTKQGKARKDKFYFLAKETGYRCRAAFKLIQLNRRFNFLGSSKVLIDLCAAPGGWMQVAAKEMPVNSIIIGVDLIPITPIPNCKSIIADITTDKCRQLVKAALLKNKANVVLHDGAPNVGAAWSIDEFSQAALCLKAFALATEFLAKGGWFITKVFRSRDYEPLKWAISQFFRKIHVLKPEASRQESAEIFLIGQNYLDPSHIDPKFLDPKHVFDEVEVVKSRETIVASLLRTSTKRKKAEGYEDEKLYKETLLSDFINTEDPLKCLAQTNKIVVDRDDLMNHPLTKPFIKESLADILVLGKSEIRALMSWRKKILASIEAADNANKPTPIPLESTEMGSSDEERETSREVERLLKDESRDNKKRLKNIRKAKRKLAERVVLKMEHPGDQIEQNNANELFSLSSIGDLSKFEQAERNLKMETGLSAVDLIARNEERKIRKGVLEKQKQDFSLSVEGGKFLSFDRHASHEFDVGALESTKPVISRDRDDIYLSSSDDDDNTDVDMDSIPESEERLISSSDEVDQFDMEDDFGSDDETVINDLNKKQGNSLLVDLDQTDQDTKDKRKINAWCNSAEVKDLLDVNDSDLENSSEKNQVTPSVVDNKKSIAAPKKVSFVFSPSTDVEKKKEKIKKLRRPLTPSEKAIAIRLIQSAKSRRDLLEWGFHRFRFFEEESSLPEWFVVDEKKHMRKLPPVSEVEKKMDRPVIGKTLKKAEEAKARKKMRSAKRLQRVRKRAENLPDDLSERETWSKIRTMYKNAGLLNKKRRPLHTIVNSKAGSRNQEQAPKGAKIKLVDKRMKCDKRGSDKKRRGGQGKKSGRGKAPMRSQQRSRAQKSGKRR